MATTLDPALQANINTGKSPGTPIELLELELQDTTVERYTNHYSNLTVFGNVFASNGLWVGLGEIEHDARGVATTWEIQLDMREPAILTKNYEAGTARLWHTFLDATGGVPGTVLIAEGEITMGDDIETLERIVRVLYVVSLQADQFAPELHARTDRGQRDRYPSDYIYSDTARLRRISFRTGGAGVKPFAGG